MFDIQTTQVLLKKLLYILGPSLPLQSYPRGCLPGLSLQKVHRIKRILNFYIAGIFFSLSWP